MVYNDHFGVLPSEVLDLLSREYKQQEQNSISAAQNLLTETLPIIKKLQHFSRGIINSFSTEIKNIISQIQDFSQKWFTAITDIFKPRQTESDNFEYSENMFEYIDVLIDLIQHLLSLSKVTNISKQKVLLDFSIEASSLLHELINILKYKNIKIFKYI